MTIEKYKELRRKNKEIVRATYMCDVNKLAELATDPDFTIYAIDDDLLCFFPVYNLNICLKYILGNTIDWNVDNRPFVEKMVEQNNRVLNWWKERGHDVSAAIPFNNYWLCFCCSEPDETDEDIFCEGDIDEYVVKYEVRKIDIQLYCAVSRFDFETVKRLLEAGANPDARLTDDLLDSGDCMKRIGVECSSISCFWFEEYKEFVEDGKIKNMNENIYNCIGYGAHECMYNLLKSYIKH